MKNCKKCMISKCYKQHGNGDGTCDGAVGGDRFTDYLSYSCVDCAYLKLRRTTQIENKSKVASRYGS